jgi:ABC-type sugar transport system ATPase subunit
MEDRKTEGLVTAMTIRENVTLASLFRLFRFGMISQRKESEAARKRVQQLRIVARSVEQTVGTLSGGNQQRTVFAKWRAAEPQLLLLELNDQGLIQHHSVYWGWYGVNVILQNRYHR